MSRTASFIPKGMSVPRRSSETHATKAGPALVWPQAGEGAPGELTGWSANRMLKGVQSPSSPTFEAVLAIVAGPARAQTPPSPGVPCERMTAGRRRAGSRDSCDGRATSTRGTAATAETAPPFAGMGDS